MQINKPKLLGFTFLHIILFITALGIASALVQSYHKEPISRGIKAVVNVSGLPGNDTLSSEIRQDFSGGSFFNYRFIPLPAPLQIYANVLTA